MGTWCPAYQQPLTASVSWSHLIANHSPMIMMHQLMHFEWHPHAALLNGDVTCRDPRMITATHASGVNCLCTSLSTVHHIHTLIISCHMAYQDIVQSFATGPSSYLERPPALHIHSVCRPSYTSKPHFCPHPVPATLLVLVRASSRSHTKPFNFEHWHIMLNLQA